MTEKQIPQDRQAEEAVLGSVLINPEIYYQVASFLKPADFYIHRNGWIWDVIGTLTNSKVDVDIVTVSSEMDRLGKDYGGFGYLSSLINQVPSSLSAVSYGRIVHNHSIRRGMITTANDWATLAYSDKPIEEVITTAQASAIKATERTNSKRVSSKEAASNAIDSVINHPRFFSFGIPNLDARLKGIFPDRLYIWGGYQGTGKTALALQNCRENAKAGKKVVLVSLEMSPEQVWLRMACGDLGVDLDSVLTREIEQDTLQEVIDLAGILGDMYENNFVIYPAPMSLMDIVSAAKMERPDIMWIDHSNLISGKPKDMDKLEWAGYIPRFLRQNIAKMDGGGISTHLLMQLNRSANKENRRPTMHDIRLAGEDDPDMITLMYRPDSGDLDNLPLGQVKVEMITDKNRFGWTGTEDVIFDLPHQRFLPTASYFFQPNKKVSTYA